MKTILASIAVLGVFSPAALGKSAYAACLESEQLLGGSLPAAAHGYRAYRGFSAIGNGYWVPSGAYGMTYPVSSLLTSFLSSEASWGEHNRVMRFVRACRHLNKRKPRAYRIVSLKSASQRSAINRPGGK